MEDSVKAIYEIIKEYRNDDGIYITPSDISAWGEQFETDADFMLNELLHLLKQVYFSKEAAREAIRKILNDQYKEYGFKTVEEYLQNTCFLNLQPEGKSQQIYIGLLDEIIYAKTGKHISDYSTYPKTLYVYLDDVLASGGTIRKDIISWLDQDNHVELVKEHKIKLEISLICVHTWGLSFLSYCLQQNYGRLPIKCRAFYEIQNHLKWDGQALNIAIPIKEQPKEVQEYLLTLMAKKYEEYAYRDPRKPDEERFFTSPENRVKFENIILEKGLYIIRQIQGEASPNIRPLGLISPNYKTFGLGTHFFTWRNVPNNCPLVYWWSVPGHNWKPLFPAKRNYNV